mgnify:CR=1 FL=1
MNFHLKGFLLCIKSLGFEYMASNPASSFRGLHESLINYGGNTKPEFLTCMHEESAVGMAHGYYLATGRPQAVMVHVNVGTANTINLLANAARQDVKAPAKAPALIPDEDRRTGQLVLRLLARFELDAGAPTTSLSKGQKTQLALVRAIAADPEYLAEISAAALRRDSFHSRAGSESATMPAPACTTALSPRTTAERIRSRGTASQRP